MKFFKWQPGRSEATKNIQKFPIWSWLGFDIYLLWFPQGQKVLTHTDTCRGKKHYRLNLTIYGFWRLTVNGKSTIQSIGSCHMFRPDINPHSATFRTNCLVLSVGWTKKQ